MTTGADWAGGVGDVWAREWRRTDRSFSELSQHLDAAILAAAPSGGGRAVDLGCGAGQTSIALATARPDLEITGVDVSPALIRIASERGGGLPNLSFVTGDVQADGATAARDAALLFSRHGVMFYDDPRAVFATLRRVAAPGARLVFSCFRRAAENPWASELSERVTGAAPAPAHAFAPGPFGFGDDDWVAAMLGAAGWRDRRREQVDFTYVAGEGDDPVGDAAAFFSRIGPVSAAIRAAPERERPGLRDRLAAALADHRQDARVCYPAAAWLWSARA